MLDELLWQQHSLGLQELLFFVHLMKKSTSSQTLPGSSGSLRLERHPHINKECLLADVVPPSRSGFLMVYHEVEPPHTALLLQEVVQEVSPQATSHGSAFSSEPPGTSDPQCLLWCKGSWCGSCGGTGRWSPPLNSEQGWPGAPSVR